MTDGPSDGRPRATMASNDPDREPTATRAPVARAASDDAIGAPGGGDAAGAKAVDARDAQREPRARSGTARRRRGPNYAAIDLGTNNCRVLIARPEGESFAVVDAYSRLVGLGEGLAHSGRLSSDAIDRTVAALKTCAERLRRHGVRRFRAVATEACRRAANQRSFLDRVTAETGLTLEVITPEQEARLAVAGCAPLVDPSAEQLLVFDIGGGSTELIRIDLSRATPATRRPLLMALALDGQRDDRARAAAAHVTDWVSLPVGVVTLGERFADIADDAARFDAMNRHVAELMAAFVARSAALGPERLGRMQVIGASGTITTLAGVHLELARYSRREVDGLPIATDAIDRVIERLLAMNAYQRAAIPSVGEDRATNLMPGAAILRAILRAWPTGRLRVADRGLREGMLYGLMQQDRWGGRGRRPG